MEEEKITHSLFFRLKPVDLFFTEIPISKKTIYRVKIYDLLHPVKCRQNGNCNYIKYEVDLVKGFGCSVPPVVQQSLPWLSI